MLEQGLGRHQHVEGHAQFHLPAAGDLARAEFRVAGKRQQPAPVLQQFAARRREARAPRAAVEDRKIEFRFQLLHRVRQRGGHAMQRLGGGSEAPIAVDGVERGERIKGQAQAHGGFPVFIKFDDSVQNYSLETTTGQP